MYWVRAEPGHDLTVADLEESGPSSKATGASRARRSWSESSCRDAAEVDHPQGLFALDDLEHVPRASSAARSTAIRGIVVVREISAHVGHDPLRPG